MYTAAREDKKYVKILMIRFISLVNSNSCNSERKLPIISLLESRQGRLWSSKGTEGPSHLSREELCKQDSSSSTDTQSTIRTQSAVMRPRRDRRTAVQNLKVSSLETETMSQDSGYHGCLRQKSLEKESQKRCKYSIVKGFEGARCSKS